ncbi:hypothetical protein Dimus_029816 [Dionaea muscipula]
MEKALLISLILVVAAAASATHVVAIGTMGGRKEMDDARSNKEIEELGRFCVDEYNKNQRNKQSRRQGGDGAPIPLEFESVVTAEKQVEAGIKYYLTINAKEGDTVKEFTAEVVDYPARNKKELLNFSPAHHPQASEPMLGLDVIRN